MSKIEIANQRLATAVRTTDAVAALSTAVENGQVRLALDLVENIIPVLIERIESLEQLLAEKVQPKEAVSVKSAPKPAKDTKEIRDSQEPASE